MILVDTIFLVAYFNLEDENHGETLGIIGNLVGKKFGIPFMTDYIFNETVTVAFIRLKSLERAEWIGDYLLKALAMKRIDEDLFLEAWNIFRSQKGTRLGFTDCTTIAIIRLQGIGNIATFDGDFGKIDGINCIGP